MNSVNLSLGDKLARKVANISKFLEAHQEQRIQQNSLRQISISQRPDCKLMVPKGQREMMRHLQKKKVSKTLAKFLTPTNTKMITSMSH